MSEPLSSNQDLVRRLRMKTGSIADKLENEAADALEAQDREIARLAAERDEYKALLTLGSGKDLLAERDRLLQDRLNFDAITQENNRLRALLCLYKRIDREALASSVDTDKYRENETGVNATARMEAEAILAKRALERIATKSHAHDVCATCLDSWLVAREALNALKGISAQHAPEGIPDTSTGGQDV